MLENVIASLTLDGNPLSLIPADMDKRGDVYTRRIGDLRIDLTVVGVADNAFSATLRLTNEGESPSPRIRDVRSFDVRFPATNAHLDGLTGDDCGAHSYVPYTRTLGEDPFVLEPLGGRSSNKTAFPFFDVTADGTTYVFGIGWTGQWHAELDHKGGTFGLSVGLADCDFYLLPHESVRFPLTLCVEGNSPLAARQAFRRLFREKFSPQKDRDDELLLPIAIQTYDRYFACQDGSNRNFVWNTEEGQIEEIDVLDAIPSIDTLWLDAAWFEGFFPMGTGNYRFVDGFPNGLRPVSDHARSKGKQFLLWFEPERVVEGTQIATEHPEFLLSAPNSDTRDVFLWRTTDQRVFLYDFSNPEAVDYLSTLIGDFIEREGIDVYRQDMNMDPLVFWRSNDAPDRRGVTEMHYVEGLYRFWDTLRARFPRLLIDNCASGGRRLDAEALSRSVSLWRSDTGCIPEREDFATSVWNNQQVMSLSRYIPYASVGNWVNQPYDVRCTGTSGIACNYDVLNPAFDFAFAETILKEVVRVRPLWNGDFYPLSDIDVRDDTWAVYQLHRNDNGAVYAFRKRKAESDVFVASLSAIDATATYRVRLTDEHMAVTESVMSGEQLRTFTFHAPETRFSLLLEYSKAE